MKNVVVVTGCDEKFFPYMDESLRSLIALGIDQRADIGVLDLGLSAQQAQQLQTMGCKVIVPTWTLSVPGVKLPRHEIGLVARSALRDYFPGYKTYLWFDADAWAQTPEFFDLLVDGAQATGAGVICENGAGYRADLVYLRWWYGHMVMAYGVINGIRISSKPVMNIGIMALSDTAPHWDSWIKHYSSYIQSRRKVDNQHSFCAAVVLDKLPVQAVSARNNWIPVLSTPMWNPETRLLCEPNKAALPLSVVHLAGPNKQRLYNLKTTTGGTVSTALTYDVISQLQKA